MAAAGPGCCAAVLAAVVVPLMDSSASSSRRDRRRSWTWAAPHASRSRSARPGPTWTPAASSSAEEEQPPPIRSNTFSGPGRPNMRTAAALHLQPSAGLDEGRPPWWQAAQRAKAPTRAGRRTEVFCAVQVYGGCSYNPPYSPPTFPTSAK